ncbi:hypothetical protein C5167_050684 [Papaver somniferum]|uniref:Uncharacterized protein n=1 Tax=Papaver somniferum TaxID=3469 RepID=A0A4Y7KTA8_PAPSO|nr:hypothetical protein C5167_050684 [Papaver somniferum]
MGRLGLGLDSIPLKPSDLIPAKMPGEVVIRKKQPKAHVLCLDVDGWGGVLEYIVASKALTVKRLDEVSAAEGVSLPITGRHFKRDEFWNYMEGLDLNCCLFDFLLKGRGFTRLEYQRSVYSRLIWMSIDVQSVPQADAMKASRQVSVSAGEHNAEPSFILRRSSGIQLLQRAL